MVILRALEACYHFVYFFYVYFVFYLYLFCYPQRVIPVERKPFEVLVKLFVAEGIAGKSLYPKLGIGSKSIGSRSYVLSVEVTR